MRKGLVLIGLWAIGCGLWAAGEVIEDKRCFEDNINNLQSTPKINRFFGDPAGNQHPAALQVECNTTQGEGREAKGERVIVPIAYGDMDQWVVRYITESKLLGGKTKTLYTLGKTDTIRENIPYVAAEDNIWGSSDTYARCFGVETAMEGSVYPERRGYGYCCRLRNVVSRIDAIDLSAMVSGTIYMGHALEPLGLQAKNKPYTAIDFGVPLVVIQAH